MLSLEQTVAANDAVKIGLGLAVISTDAFDLGATAFPDPSGEPEFPWYWWSEFHLASEGTAIEAAAGIQNVRIEVDSKAMRKVKPGETLAWVVQYSDILGTPPVQILLAQVRVLIGT